MPLWPWKGLENAGLRQAGKGQRNSRLGVEGWSAATDHALAEYILCLSLPGFLVDWPELMGEKKNNKCWPESLAAGLSR